MQNIIVYNKEWEKIGFIDTYISLIWTKCYTSPGDFELYLLYSKHLIDVLKTGNYVALDGSADIGIYAMIIERIEITQSIKEGTTILVTGRSLLSILERRVLYDEILETATCFDFISSLINNCFGLTALIPRRWVENKNAMYFIFNLTNDSSLRVRAASKGDNLLEIITELCEENGMGIDILFNNGMFNIYVYKYDSKSSDIIFSSELDNLAECKYVTDISGYANVARVSNNENHVTAPNGADGTYKTELSGLNRYECLLSTDYAGESNGISALQASGTRQLRKKQNTEEITADILSDKVYQYGVDYFVGDTVTIKTDFGITATAQISEMTESWSIDGYKLIPTFRNYIIMQEEV